MVPVVDVPVDPPIGVPVPIVSPVPMVPVVELPVVPDVPLIVPVVDMSPVVVELVPEPMVPEPVVPVPECDPRPLRREERLCVVVPVEDAEGLVGLVVDWPAMPPVCPIEVPEPGLPVVDVELPPVVV